MTGFLKWERKWKACLNTILNNFLFFLLNHLVFFLGFSDVYYKQIDDVATGSPLGPTLANLFLVYDERKWLESCAIQIRPKYYSRYVDDIFVMFKHKDHVEKFLRYMNSCHCNIQFTCEKESNDKTSFLDISITRSKTKLVTSLCRKKTFVGVYMNYNNFLSTN